MDVQFGDEHQKLKSTVETIPTLEQVFERFPNMMMNIELKTPSPEAVSEFTRLLRQYNRTENTLIGIRKDEWHQKLHQSGQFKTFFSDKQLGRVILSYLTGLLPFLSLSDDSFQIALYTENFYAWKKREWQSTFKTEMFFWMVRLCNILFRPLLWYLRRRGLVSMYWVCNNEE